MKTKVRSIFVAVVIFSVLLFVNLQALAETRELALNTGISCAGGENYFTFTPTETGFYKFYSKFDFNIDGPEYMVSIDADAFIYDQGSGSIVNESQEWIGEYEYITYLMFSGETYNIVAYWTEDPQATKNGTFTVSANIPQYWGEIKAGETVSNSRGYIKFVPDQTAYIHLQGYGNIIDITNKQMYSYADKVIKGNEYWLLNIAEGAKLEYLPDADNTTVTTRNIADMQSTHPYANNLNKSWVYTAPEGTAYSEITFSEDTYIDESYDWLYIYDGDGNSVKKYGYRLDDLAGETIALGGDSFTIKLCSGEGISAYGYSLTDIKSYDTVPVPVADIESGSTIRPNDLNLTASTDAAQIYYRIGDSGEYTLYDSAIPLTESCTVYTYAKICGRVSDTAQYTYVVNAEELEAPTFVLSYYNSGEPYLSATAPEGTIYYKQLLNSYWGYKVYEGGSMTSWIDNDIIAAYAQSGNQKSKVVYYRWNTGDTGGDSGEYDIEAPVMNVTDILGGKKLEIKVPEGIKLLPEQYSESETLVTNHNPMDCGYKKHKNWWTLYERGKMSIIVSDASARAEKEITSGTSVSYTLTETTAVEAQINTVYDYACGTWETRLDMTGTFMEHNPVRGDGCISNYYYSPAVAECMIIPTAEKPYIRIVGNEVQITAEDGVMIYYSVNGSDYTEYTAPFNAVGGDRIKAYAIGMGIAKSEISKKAVPVTERFGIVLENDLTVNTAKTIENLEIKLVNNAALDKTYNLAVAVFDNESNTFCDIKTKKVAMTGKATTTVDDISLSVEDDNADPCVKIFLWDIAEPMSAMTQKKTCFVE